ncbi:MAG: acyltransferase [Leptotrichiaceae bacterium]|nr:acyltransferase [Leptotrichiaceae bacterium]
MRDKHKDIFRYIAGIPKSFYFNFKKFGFLKALKFPVILSSNVILDNVSGDIEIKKMKPFGVRIGFGHSDIYVYQGEKTILKNTGKIIFNGKCKIGFGSGISNEGILEFGENFSITFRGKIACRKSIKIGNDCMVSWDTLIMDTDHHDIFENKLKINESKPIVIGDKNWIGARAVILKGVTLGNGNVVALGAILTKKYDCNNKIIAGSPAKIIKEGIEWK